MSGTTATPCGLCSKPATQSCSSCNLVNYCNREHQKEHWNDHKGECGPFKVLTNKTLGRYLVASRDIAEGEVILRSTPLVIGPKTLSRALCLGCHNKLTHFDSDSKCSKCRWYLCSEGCEESELHKDECDILQKNGYKPYVDLGDYSKKSAYAATTPLRCLLLKKTDPKKFEMLMSFQSHLEENQETPMYQMFKRYLVSVFTQTLKLDTTEEEVLKICSILDTNSFDVRDPESSKISVRALYPIINLLAHDCKHNAKHTFNADNNFEIVLTATIPIKEGELISTTYTQTLWGTMERRAHLLQSKHFMCGCKRCSDPTEFGTYVGSFYCTQCRVENKTDQCPKIISTDPLDQNALWKCERNCGYEVTGKEIVWGNDVLKAEIKQIDKSDPTNLEDFLYRYEDVLHPRNSHALEVKYALTQMYGNADGYRLHELSDEYIIRKIQLCKELLEVADILEPGVSRFRGCLLYDLQAAMLFKTKRDYIEGKITKEAAQDILTESQQILNKSAKILISEPDMKRLLEEQLKQSTALLNLD